MGYKEEFIVSPKISIGTFPRNSPTDFKYTLDTKHAHRFHNAGFRVRKVLLSFEKVHYIHTMKPSIILSTDVEDNTKINDKAPPQTDYFLLNDENLLMGGI